jgi:hypothetical protein
MAKQPCVSCGDETATGSPLYPTRTEVVAPDGMAGFLCSDCHVRITGHDRGRIGERDIRRLREAPVSAGAWSFTITH